MLDARHAAGSLLMACVVAFLGALLLRWIDTAAIWFYVLGIVVTAGAMVQALPGSTSRSVSLSLLSERRTPVAFLERRAQVVFLIAVIAGLLLLAKTLCLFPFSSTVQPTAGVEAFSARPRVSNESDVGPASPALPKTGHYHGLHSPTPSESSSIPTQPHVERGTREVFEDEPAASGERRSEPARPEHRVESGVRSGAAVRPAADRSEPSPLLPILVAISVLACVSVAVVVARRRRLGKRALSSPRQGPR
jgi:hypothetical protein